MIKLQDILKETTVACGDCLGYVYRQSADLLDSNAQIVYGTVSNKWLSDGKRYPHAWIEMNNRVFDWQTNELGMSKYSKDGWPIKDFYNEFNPMDMKKYTPMEVLKNKGKYKTLVGHDWEENYLH